MNATAARKESSLKDKFFELSFDFVLNINRNRREKVLAVEARISCEPNLSRQIVSMSIVDDDILSKLLFRLVRRSVAVAKKMEK